MRGSMIEEEQQHLMISSMQLGEREVGQLIKRLRQTCLPCPRLLLIKIPTMTDVVPSLWSILVA